MTVYSEAEIRESIKALLDEHDLTWDDFIALGDDDELVDIDVDLDFAYRNLVPHLKDTPIPA